MSRGQNPSEAELYYLDNAKNLAMYGVHMHDAEVTCCAFFAAIIFRLEILLNLAVC